MREPSVNVLSADPAQRIDQGIQKGIPGSGFGRSQSRLDLRPTQFNRIEIWRVRREEDQASTPSFDQVLGVITLMSRQIIQHDQVAFTQRRRKHRFHIRLKTHRIHRPFQNPRGFQSLPSHTRHHCVVGTRIAWGGFHHPLSGTCTTIKARHSHIGPKFIDKFQSFDQCTQPILEFGLKCISQRLYTWSFSLTVVE